MKKHLINILLYLVILVGLSLLLYPTVSNWWNSMHQGRAVTNYTDVVSQLSQVEYTSYWDAACAYNDYLLTKRNRMYMDDEERAWYNTLLNLTGNGVMGSIEIESLGVNLPVYHGTSDGVLQVAIGHIEGSSLPVGGIGTHCVLSGHRGLPSAQLFSNLDRMKTGDTFVLHVLDETLTYEVDQILVVLPEDMGALAIDPEQDYCTLITCTPYGINTHRLLVRGHRVETIVEAVKEKAVVQSNAEVIDQWLVAMCVAVPLLLVWLIAVFFPHRRRK